MSQLQEQFFDPELIRETVPDLLAEGIWNTLQISLAAAVIGLALGLLLALVAISRRWWVRLPAVIYIDVFRGLPSILTIVLVGLGLPLAGFDLFGRNQMLYGILAIGLISAAYVAEIFRAGIQSVDTGQLEAARSLGLSYPKAMRLVVVPQAVRRVLPPLTSEFILLVKDSSLLFVLGLQIGERDIFRVGQNLSQETLNYTPVLVAGVCYLLITIPLTRLVNYLDKRMREGPQARLGALELER